MEISSIQTITLGMGCFWGPDALFGQIPGVVRTRTGYAGGTRADPTYRELGDHTEMVEIDFDPQSLRLETILDVFWNGHNPENINDYKGRQYQSLVLYRDEAQHRVIQELMEARKEQGNGTPGTEVVPFAGFYVAEDRHQKYYLKRYPDAIDKLSPLYPTHEELVNATLTARLNGLAKGFTNLARIVQEIQAWPISQEEQAELILLIQRIRW